MTVQEAVASYYDGWQNKAGDLSEVPLADDFSFSGPVASFDNAAGFREMAAEAGQAVTSFSVRRQFVDGNTVCSIIDWEMAMPGVGKMTAAELLEVEDGTIVSGELIYDAEELRKAMARREHHSRGAVEGREERAFQELAEIYRGELHTRSRGRVTDWTFADRGRRALGAAVPEVNQLPLLAQGEAPPRATRYREDEERKHCGYSRRARNARMRASGRGSAIGPRRLVVVRPGHLVVQAETLATMRYEL